ncbi:MAG: hypothetical protein IPO40_23070 [Fibrobacteres bacterium]|nr:hypothetical protein [Fibrobacterota bacterium]
MKRFALLAIAGTAIAQVPAPAPAPVPAPVEAPVTGGNIAPVAPIHDDLINGNPAIDRSIGGVMLTPNLYYGERAAAFQWNGSSASSFAGSGVAIVNQVFAGFTALPTAGIPSNGQLGELALGYLRKDWGLGLRYSRFNRAFAAGTDSADLKTRVEVYPPTTMGLFGSFGLQNKLTGFARIDYSTPSLEYTQETARTPAVGSITTKSRSDSLGVQVGVISEAKGNRGISYVGSLGFGQKVTRASGQDDKEQLEAVYFEEKIGIGRSFSAEGVVFGAGLNQRLVMANAKGVPQGTALTGFNNYDPAFYSLPGDSTDWSILSEISPNMCIIIPVFENWTLKGGTSLTSRVVMLDALAGDDAMVYSRGGYYSADGQLGIRYAKVGARWAAEAQVQNAFLTRGPNFVSGAAGNLFASLAVTANFK